jgi:hypothetical protein
MTTFDPRTVAFPHTDQSFGAQQYGTPTVPGQQFPGPVPPPPFRPKNKRPLAAKIVAGLVAAGLVVGGAGAWMAFSGSDAEAAVQSTSFAGAHPTTAPFGVDAPQVAAVAATGPQAGDTTGLYAATTPPACTTADFLSQLQADPAKLAAFGGVYGLGASDVPAFVDSLAPVVLRANTSVTDHPYVDGAFTPQPAVLAAGTAVLVNSYGEPTVKCYNGNPLTGGALAPDAISVVPTDQVITNYQFTTIDNSSVVIVPGKPDPKPHPGHNPDPFLQAKADAAAQLAENARTAATTARADATTAAQNQKAAQANLDAADLAIAQLQAKLASINPALDPAGFQQAKDALERAAVARQQLAGILKTATDAATAADKKAKDLEDQATADEQAAAKAKQDAEDSKHPHAAKQDQEPGKAGDPAATGQQDPKAPGQNGQNVQDPKQAPAKQATVKVQQQTCTEVADNTATAAAPNCPILGSADAAQGTTPATTGTTGTTGAGTAKTSTGSTQGSGSSSKGSSSSSSSGTSTKNEKGGSDK